MPLLANRSSVPAPDDEKLSLSAGLTPKAGVSAALTAPAVIAPGVMAWPIHCAGIRAADRDRQTVALGDLFDQAGIGAGQILDGDLVGPGSGEIEFDPRIGRLAARCVGRRADEPAIAVEDEYLEVRGGGAIGLVPLQQQGNGVAGPSV